MNTTIASGHLHRLAVAPYVLIERSKDRRGAVTWLLRYPGRLFFCTCEDNDGNVVRFKRPSEAMEVIQHYGRDDVEVDQCDENGNFYNICPGGLVA